MNGAVACVDDLPPAVDEIKRLSIVAAASYEGRCNLPLPPCSWTPSPDAPLTRGLHCRSAPSSSNVSCKPHSASPPSHVNSPPSTRNSSPVLRKVRSLISSSGLRRVLSLNFLRPECVSLVPDPPRRLNHRVSSRSLLTLDHQKNQQVVGLAYCPRSSFRRPYNGPLSGRDCVALPVGRDNVDRATYAPTLPPLAVINVSRRMPGENEARRLASRNITSSRLCKREGQPGLDLPLKVPGTRSSQPLRKCVTSALHGSRAPQSARPPLLNEECSGPGHRRRRVSSRKQESTTEVSVPKPIVDCGESRVPSLIPHSPALNSHLKHLNPRPQTLNGNLTSHDRPSTPDSPPTGASQTSNHHTPSSNPHRQCLYPNPSSPYILPHTPAPLTHPSTPPSRHLPYTPRPRTPAPSTHSLRAPPKRSVTRSCMECVRPALSRTRTLHLHSPGASQQQWPRCLHWKLLGNDVHVVSSNITFRIILALSSKKLSSRVSVI